MFSYFPNWKAVLALLLATTLIACGGGSSGDGGSDNGDDFDDGGTVDDDTGDEPGGDDNGDSDDDTGDTDNPQGFASLLSFDVPIISNSWTSTPNNAAAVALGPNGNIHLAWSAPAGEELTEIRYGVFDGENFQSAVVTATQYHRQRSPDIVVDSQGSAHIAWHTRKTEENLFRDGNFTIHYATGTLGGFEVSAASVDLADPTANTESEFLAGVANRPQITLTNDDTPVVQWIARRNTANSSDEYFVRATRSGAGWFREALFIPRDIHPDEGRTISRDAGFGLTRPLSSEQHVAWIDISDYQPWVATEASGAWSVQALDVARGSFAAKHMQVEMANNGDIHYLWMSETDAGEEAAAVAVQTSAGVQVQHIPLQQSLAGNFLPGTIDPVTGEPFFVYFQGGLGTAQARFLVRDGQEYELPHEGVFCGRRSLIYNNGQLIHVTCDMSGDEGQFHFTVMDLSSLGDPADPSAPTDPSEPTEPSNPDGNALESDVPVTGLSGELDSQIYYTIEVPAGAANLVVDTAEGTGDMDLFLMDPDGAEACQSEYLENGEICIISAPEAGTWTIELFGYEAYSGVRLVAYSRAHTGKAGDITSLADVAGVYDWSDDYEGGITDEWYLAIDASGNMSDYDYQGDNFDEGGDCYFSDRNWEQLTHISANRFSSLGLGEVTLEVIMGNLVIIPVYDTEAYSIIGPEVSRSESDMISQEC